MRVPSATDVSCTYAGVTARQCRRLAAAGVPTLAELAAYEGRIRGMADETLTKLRTHGASAAGPTRGRSPGDRTEALERPDEVSRACRCRRPGTCSSTWKAIRSSKAASNISLASISRRTARGSFRAWWAHDAGRSGGGRGGPRLLRRTDGARSQRRTSTTTTITKRRR